MTIVRKTLQHEFVEFIPDKLDEGVIYVALEHNTVVHLCCCGCKNEIVTPLSPAAWSIGYNGKSVSLYPSIGSWNLPCQSHYWIRNGHVITAPRWSKDRIERGRQREREDRERYYAQIDQGQDGFTISPNVEDELEDEFPGRIVDRLTGYPDDEN
jgi:hypothetical protein